MDADRLVRVRESAAPYYARCLDHSLESHARWYRVGESKDQEIGFVPVFRTSLVRAGSAIDDDRWETGYVDGMG